MSESITKELLEQFEKKCSADAACQVAKNAVTENGLKASAKNVPGGASFNSRSADWLSL